MKKMVKAFLQILLAQLFWIAFFVGTWLAAFFGSAHGIKKQRDSFVQTIQSIRDALELREYLPEVVEKQKSVEKYNKGVANE